MTKTILTDSELDNLLSSPSMPLAENGFTDKLLLKIKRREKLQRIIPAAFGIVGAAISVYFMPVGLFTELPAMSLSWKEMVTLAANPLTLALLLSSPLAILAIKSD